MAILKRHFSGKCRENADSTSTLGRFPQNCQTNHPYCEPGNLTAGFKRRLTADQQRLSEINHDGKIHGDIRGDTTTYILGGSVWK
jgi:hypothetical protein